MSSGAGHFPHRYLWAYGVGQGRASTCCASTPPRSSGHTGVRVNTGPARDHRRRADGVHHRRGPAARRLPGRDADQPGRARSRTWPPPCGSWPGRSRPGSPGWRCPVDGATTSGGAPTTGCCSASEPGRGVGPVHHPVVAARLDGPGCPPFPPVRPAGSLTGSVPSGTAPYGVARRPRAARTGSGRAACGGNTAPEVTHVPVHRPRPHAGAGSRRAGRAPLAAPAWWPRPWPSTVGAPVAPAPPPRPHPAPRRR